MGYSAPSQDRIVAGTARDSDSSYQCGNFRNRFHGCSSHFIKASDLEAAILQAVQAVSSYVLKDEEAFVDQLMEQWELKQEQSSSDDRKEIAAAKKRLSELDELIQGLYESQIKGTLPERQAQRLISQYDGEQLQLESRISELEKSEATNVPKKTDINRFIALVRKYQIVTEVTDTMLYEFIDRVEVHAATGGSTRYRQQIIDIHFNFIGQFMPPGSVMSEEERIAMIDAEQEEKLAAKRKRRCESCEKNASLRTTKTIRNRRRYEHFRRQTERRKYAPRRSQEGS